MKKEEDQQLENFLEEVTHEMKMTMEIMNINNKYFTNLIAFQVNEVNDIEKV